MHMPFPLVLGGKMSTDYPIAYSDLLALAPVQLANHRDLRYMGDEMGVAISDFDQRDSYRIQHLYTTLSRLLHILQEDKATLAACVADLKRFMHEVNWVAFLGEVRQIGAATYEQHATPLLSQVVHDIKGGSLVALSIHLQLLEMGLEDQENTTRLFFLTRDHLKMMRNAVRDLDPVAQERDRSDTKHSVQLLVEKWHDVVYRLQGSSAEIVLDTRFAGSISERCLEFSALDRSLYNLINNAVRNTSDNRVYFVILPLPEEHPFDLRFVIYNRIPKEHLRTLQARYNGNLSDLFRGGFTTGGSGLGMRICADFVNNAYGILEFDVGLAGGYFGARCIGEYFVNWLHWPIVAD